MEQCDYTDTEIDLVNSNIYIAWFKRDLQLLCRVLYVGVSDSSNKNLLNSIGRDGLRLNRKCCRALCMSTYMITSAQRLDRLFLFYIFFQFHLFCESS